MQEGLNDTVGWDHAWRGNAFCDHYQAVPIGDGWNMLFTDPEDGNLCLGDDAPPDFGATKLVRRYILVGPKDAEGKAIVPRTYKSGGELRWGTRVVVGYGERLWLFVVPPDQIAKEAEKIQSKKDQQYALEGPTEPVPTRIDGVEFGRVPNPVDVAVDSTGGGLTVWVFAMDGMAYVWQLGGGPKPITGRIVLQDGTIVPEKDEDGDTFMNGTSSPSGRAVQFDGSVSARPTISMNFGEEDRIIDKDSDIAMPDVISQEDEGYTSGTKEFAQAEDEGYNSGAEEFEQAEDEGYTSGAEEFEQAEDEGYTSGAEEFEQGGGAFAIHTLPLLGTRSEPDRIIDKDSDIAMPDTTSQEDEGYTSSAEEFEQAGGAFAIHEESADRVPNFLRAIEDEDLGVDMMELGRCEIEILSSHVEVGGVGFGRWTTETADIERRFIGHSFIP